MANLNERIENESVILERDTSKLPKGVIARVSRIVCWLDEKNANNRKYGRDVWESVFNNQDFKRKMENRQILGEYEHPESSALKLDKDRTSHIVSRMYVGDSVIQEGHSRIPVKAEFDLLPTDAGKFILILHEAGVKVGASTRADGSLLEEIDEDGSKYMRVDPKDYRFVTIDHTGDPSCSNTEPESIISAVQSHYEAHTINKNVAIALLESVHNEAAKALEKIIKEDKQHKECKHKLSEKGCSGQCVKASVSEDTMVDKGIVDELCTCRHLKSEHQDAAGGLASGHGACTKCGCPKFTWHEFLYNTIESVTETIKKIGPDKWRLYSKDGKKNLGTFDSLEAAKKHEGEVQYFKSHESKVNEELTTSSDMSGQPANLAASKDDMEKSKKRTEDTDRNMQSVADRPLESKVSEHAELSALSDAELLMRYKELSKDPHQEVQKEVEALMSEIQKRKLEDKVTDIGEAKTQVAPQDIGARVKEFLDDNWSLFLRDSDLSNRGNPNSKEIDAINNVSKVFKIPVEQAKQYVKQMAAEPHPILGRPVSSPGFPTISAVHAPSNEKVEPKDSPKMDESSNRLDAVTAESTNIAELLKTIQENYAKDVVRFANEIENLKEDKATVVNNYSKDSIHFASEVTETKKQLEEAKRENIQLHENLLGQHSAHLAETEKLNAHIAKLTEEKAKITGEMNEKTNRLGKELATKETAIKESERKYKLLQETSQKEVTALKEEHQKHTINLYVDYRVKSMGLKLHENVLTLLRQAKSTSEVDALIRETQDALREGLTQSVGKIYEVVVARPVDKNQADINDKVGIALKHFTGL